MSNEIELFVENRPETNAGDEEDIFPEFPFEAINPGVKESSRTPTSPNIFITYVRKRANKPDDYIKRLGPTTLGSPFDESWQRFIGIEERIRAEIREIIHSEFRHISETHWVQNLQHPAYHLRQPIPILIERTDDAVKATYDDVELHSTGANEKEAKSNLCSRIVARYKELEDSDPKSQDYMFLKRIIEEVEPEAWQELKQLYSAKLEEIPHVQKGYIRIEGKNAEVIILLTEESVEIIMELAQLDLEINQNFRFLSFSAEYESAEDYLELEDFECFYENFS